MQGAYTTTVVCMVHSPRRKSGEGRSDEGTGAPRQPARRIRSLGERPGPPRNGGVDRTYRRQRGGPDHDRPIPRPVDRVPAPGDRPLPSRHRPGGRPPRRARARAAAPGGRRTGGGVDGDRRRQTPGAPDPRDQARGDRGLSAQALPGRVRGPDLDPGEGARAALPITGDDALSPLRHEALSEVGLSGGSQADRAGRPATGASTGPRLRRASPRGCGGGPDAGRRADCPVVRRQTELGRPPPLPTPLDG